MNPIRHPTTNAVLSPPRDWDDARDGECVSLWVRHHQGVFYSYWKPSAGELDALAAGGHVRLAVVGSAHPPVCLDTET